MVWKNIKKWIGIGALAGSLLIPSVAKGYQDFIYINHRINEERGNEIQIGHHASSTEGYGAGDVEYVDNPLWITEWEPRISTTIDGHQLERDLRFTNSPTSFATTLGISIHDGSNHSQTNRLQIKVANNGTYPGFDSKRHYVGEYNVYSNFTANGLEFKERKNLRSLCPLFNTYYFWDGVNLNLLASQTNAQGIIDFGNYTQNCDWNQLVSSSTSGGTNTPNGAEILDYNTNKTVNLQANPGNYIDYYVLTRTDNTGIVNTVTNDIAGTGVTSTNVALNGIMGSNELYAVYAGLPTFNLTVNSAHGGAYPGTTNNVAGGTTLDEYITNSPVSLGEGVRAVANGGSVIGNDYIQNNLTNITVNGSGLTNNATLNWLWNTNYLLTAGSSGNGTVDATNSWENAGTNKNLTATPNQYFHFAGWTGDTNAPQNPLTLNMDKPYNVTANFAENLTPNGIPHSSWLARYGLGTNDSVEAENPDGDNLNNLEEYLADTNPTNGASAFPYTGIAKGSSIEVSVNPSSTGRNYKVYSTTNFPANWKPETNSVGNGSNLTFHLTSDDSAAKYYQTRVGLNP